LRDVVARVGVASTINRVGSMMTAFFVEGPVTDWQSAAKADAEQYARFFRAMLEEGIYLAPSQFECAFVSTAHSDQDIEKTIEAARSAMRPAG
jgi:glutamate-1-semialdehyde 2,1-aminomutase